MELLTTEFLSFLTQTRQMKQNTVKSYERDLKAFLSFAYRNTEDGCQKVCDRFPEYIESLKSSNRSSATISRNIASLRCFFRYLTGKNVLKTDPSEGKKYEQHPIRQTSYEELLTTDEVDRLIGLSKTDDIKGYRDCAILETLYATGLKVGEFLSLSVSDLHLKEGYVTVTTDGHTRYVPLYKGALTAIRNYLKHSRRYLISKPGTDILFLNQNGLPLSRQGLWKLLKTYAQKAGISKELTPHLFRRSMAMHLVENGADLSVVQELLGHKNIELTKQYVKDFKPKIISDYTKYHPKSRTGDS